MAHKIQEKFIFQLPPPFKKTPCKHFPSSIHLAETLGGLEMGQGQEKKITFTHDTCKRNKNSQMILFILITTLTINIKSLKKSIPQSNQPRERMIQSSPVGECLQSSPVQNRVFCIFPPIRPCSSLSMTTKSSSRNRSEQ